MSTEKKISRDTSVKILNADMTDEMSAFACQAVQDAFNESNSEKKMADAIRLKFNTTHGLIWNVVVGKNFASNVTHATKKYINLEIGHLTMLIWKSN
mmetsp:Transcript_48821/g.81043  ORF Transcript_48821/g.81043 Transcript_48821/m.81043 type:complete len:97 (+) Transcript_48821:51-341(+)